MALTIEINTDVGVFRDATKKSVAFNMDDAITKATLNGFTKHHDELIPALAGGSPGTPVSIDLTRFTTVRGIQVLSTVNIVALIDFNDTNGVREIPIANGVASSASAVTYGRFTLETSAMSSLSFRNDGTDDAEIQFLLWGT